MFALNRISKDCIGLNEIHYMISLSPGKRQDIFYPEKLHSFLGIARNEAYADGVACSSLL